MEIPDFLEIHYKLLSWYTQHCRHLPWRAPPGHQPDPYHVLLSEIMLQQTTVRTVISYFNRFIERWPTLHDLAQASRDNLYHQWQGLGYYSRARNLYSCITTLARDYNGQIPHHPDQLIKLPGIGPYTAASIAAIAYDYPIVPVDGNVTRVIARLLALKKPLPGLKNDVFESVAPLKPERAGDFAQSLMDIGATICKPKNPLCDRCPVAKNCQSFQTDQHHRIPIAKLPTLKPTRYTYAFWCQDEDGLVFLTRRPETGLLANMVGLPTCDWVEDQSSLPSIDPQWSLVPKTISHTFTHFHLKVICFITKRIDQPHLLKVSPEKFSDYPIPTLMAKIMRVCIDHYGLSSN